MNFELIVALSQNGIIGDNNKIPWYIPEDLYRFSKITKNSILIMGRKTFDSLPNGPLNNRIHIILSRDENNTKSNENVIFVNMQKIFDTIKRVNIENKKIFVIGGSEIYKLFIHYCKIIHITMIYDNVYGDIFFPYDNEYLLKYYDIIDKSDMLCSKNGNMKYQYITFSAKDFSL
jgi:dihydrofolate reductase